MGSPTRVEDQLLDELERVFGGLFYAKSSTGRFVRVVHEGWPDEVAYDPILALPILNGYPNRYGISESGDAEVCRSLETAGATQIGSEGSR